MKKVLVTIFSAVLILLLVACGGNNVDDSVAEKYISKTEEIISLLNEENYEEVHAMFDDEMETELTVEDMNEFTSIIEGSGEFEDFDKSSVEENNGHYITVITGKYSNENRVFTITFNKDDEIAGLFIN